MGFRYPDTDIHFRTPDDTCFREGSGINGRRYGLGILLEDKGIDVSKAVIPNIQEKILELEEKINEIITTDPYNYKFLLEDNEETEQRIKDLEDEKNVYIKYREELEETLRMLTGE